MTDREMREELKKGKIADRYLLISDESVLIDRSIAAIREAIKADPSFDVDSFFADDVEIEAIVERVHSSPFASARRLIVVKGIDKYQRGDLKKFADMVNRAPAANCLVMVYSVDSSVNAKKPHVSPKEVPSFFKHAELVTYNEEKEKVHDKIMATIKRDRMALPTAIVDYLESEFGNDLTGLKNEFDKIRNYLYEAKQVGLDEVMDLSVGLCDYGKYSLGRALLEKKSETLSMFEELKLYYKYPEIVDALVRGMLYNDRMMPDRKALKTLLENIRLIDRKMKTSTYFEDLHFELFFMKNMTLTRKGGVYGR